MRFPGALAAVALAATVAGSVGCGGGGASHRRAAAPPPPPGPCRPAPAIRRHGPRSLPQPALRPDRRARLAATVATNCGTFTIALDAAQQPKTVASFAYLARHGFYDGLTFYRVSRAYPGPHDFVVLGGDPNGDGTGGPGYTIVEPPPQDARYVQGTVAMFHTEKQLPGTSGSAFFVVTAKSIPLPADFALLGHVTSGWDAVRRIAAIPSSPPTERPVRRVVIERLTVGPR